MPRLEDRVFTQSDLATRRTEFIEVARTGRAVLRTTDGTPLVMLRGTTVDHLSQLRDHVLAYLMVESALSRPADARRPADFGAWAFLAVFDDDDLAEFRDEMNQALVIATSAQDVSNVDRLVDEWRHSAQLLGNELAMSIVRGELDDDEWHEVDRPS